MAKRNHSWAMSMLDELKEYFGSTASSAKPKGRKSTGRKKAKTRSAKMKSKKR